MRDELRERLADAAKFLRRCRGTEPVEFFEEHATACEEAAALLAPQEAREPEALRQTIAEAVERLADRLYPYWRSSEGDGSDYLAVANTIDVLAGKLTAAHQERDADARRLARRLANATPPSLDYPNGYTRLAERFHAILTDAAMAADTQTEGESDAE